MWKICILLTPLVIGVASFRDFQRRIPNGDIVPHPCEPNNIWDGVGHFLDEGTGFRNPFGTDFAAEGKQWTKTLCEKDSDGDGLTNGQELGDPDCQWTPGTMPQRQTGLSHPGICDPWDEPDCFKKPLTHPLYKTQEEWMREMCKPDIFQCAAVNETGVVNVTLRLPPTPVPAKETTYECQIWDLSELGVPDGDYHMVAIEPHIDNKYVLHHMVLFGCMDQVQTTPQPFECGMLASQLCQDFLSVWTVGVSGECLHPDTGIRLGTKGYKKIAMQFHWNNPERRSDHVDSSGLLLHYTPNLRTYDSGMMMTGTDYFYLPPQQEKVTIDSACSSGCTQKYMTGPINVTMAWNHMHYAGTTMITEVKRNNTHLTYLANDPVYSYDSPQMHFFLDNPIHILPGDEIRTTCTYNTMHKTTTTFYGDATSDEMCFGFLAYHPKQNLQKGICVDAFGISFCDESTFGDCNSTQFYRDVLPSTDLFKDVQANCRPYTPCLHECIETMSRYMQNEPCMKGKMWEFIQTRFLKWDENGKDMMSRVASCKAEVDRLIIG